MTTKIVKRVFLLNLHMPPVMPTQLGHTYPGQVYANQPNMGLNVNPGYYDTTSQFGMGRRLANTTWGLHTGQAAYYGAEPAELDCVGFDITGIYVGGVELDNVTFESQSSPSIHSVHILDGNRRIFATATLNAPVNEFRIELVNGQYANSLDIVTTVDFKYSRDEDGTKPASEGSSAAFDPLNAHHIFTAWQNGPHVPTALLDLLDKVPQDEFVKRMEQTPAGATILLFTRGVHGNPSRAEFTPPSQDLVESGLLCQEFVEWLGKAVNRPVSGVSRRSSKEALVELSDKLTNLGVEDCGLVPDDLAAIFQAVESSPHAAHWNASMSEVLAIEGPGQYRIKPAFRADQVKAIAMWLIQNGFYA